MKGKLIFSLVVIFCCSMMFSCSEKPAPPAGGSRVDQILKPPPTDKTVKSTDGTCQVTVPVNWTEETTLNKEAKLQTAMRMRDAFLVVFVTQKDKYGDIKLEDFAQGTNKKLWKRLTSVEGGAPAKVTVGGLPGLQYALTGRTGGSTFSYIQTLLEGPVYYYEILTWTPRMQTDKNKPLFDAAINSFKELTPPPAPVETKKETKKSTKKS